MKATNVGLRFGFGAAFLVCLFAVGAARATLIDFEAFSAGPQPSTFLASYGISSVTYVGGGGFEVYDNGSDPSFNVPSPTHLFYPSGGAFPSPTGIFTTEFDFATPVNSFSFKKTGINVPTYGTAGWKADAYDASDAMMGEQGIGFAAGLDYPPSSTPLSFYISGPNPITKVIFSVNYNYQSTSGTVLLDDFQFDLVPEPASATILGLAGTCLLRRRRRSA